MNFGQPESLVEDPTSVGHYFDIRAENLVDTPTHWRQYLEEIQNTVLSQIALNFRSLHGRLDGIEEKLELMLRKTPGDYFNTKVSNMEASLENFLTSTQKPNQTPQNMGTHNNNISYEVAMCAPNSSTQPHSGTNSIINALSPSTPVSQLPSEESAKVKVLLRQFAGNAMSYIEKNATNFIHVNNHDGAISTMKRFGLYHSPAWDNFTQLHFPHVLKRDLTEELVKIVSVKVKNTKARYKKRQVSGQASEPTFDLDG